MNEENNKYQFITPAIERAGWRKDQIAFEYAFTDGRVIVRGRMTARGKRKRADYLLSYKANLPLAIVEAKDDQHSLGDGMQQGIAYAKTLDIPFAYSSNGKGFIEHDFLTGKESELKLSEFPSPEKLWQRLKTEKGYTDEQTKVVEQPYYFKIGDKTPRYYQRIAINKTVEAIAQGQQRILLVMAMGTGKTYTAFQIIHRLHQAGSKRNILYLADRNILIDQTMTNDFKPFKKIMTKVEDRKLDSAYQIYMSLYHQLAGEEQEEPFRQFKPDFFDLIIVDECHRGSAKDESRWRKILDYFSSATHIGLTATPKETKEVSSKDYFGESIYTYSLKQGIDDGFLAPYKVVRVIFDKDTTGWRPAAGKLDKFGNEIPDQIYGITDYDKSLVIEERTQAVAERITEYLMINDRFSKTIVFCVDIDHAERMRQALVNLNSDLVQEDPRYIMRITGDNEEGKKQLDNFIDVNEKYPTIVTTSKLMTTGVDCKTCKVIVLDNNINSITEFKQIIGRGTRLFEQDGKMYFTIIDFRNASRLFADKDFDGDPVKIYQPKDGEPMPDERADTGGDEEGGYDILNSPEFPGSLGDGQAGKLGKIYVNGVLVRILYEGTSIYGEGGKLITDNIRDYAKQNLLNEFGDLRTFIRRWTDTDKKSAITEALREQGVLLDAIREEADLNDMDDFDLICHVAFDQKPLTKAERINNVKKRDYLHKYSGAMKEVLSILMDKYMNVGLDDFTDTQVLKLSEFHKFGSPMKIVKDAGGKHKYHDATKDLEKEIYTNHLA